MKFISQKSDPPVSVLNKMAGSKIRPFFILKADIHDIFSLRHIKTVDRDNGLFIPLTHFFPGTAHKPEENDAVRVP